MSSHKAKTKDLTKTIGECGRFQLFLTMAVHAASMNAVWGMMFMVFGMYNPGWTCLDQEMTGQFLLSNNTHISPSLSIQSSLTIEEHRKNVTSWSLDCAFKKKCRKWIYNQDSSTVVSKWNLSCDLDWVPSVIISIQMTGVLIGSYVAGQIGDRFGRKASLYSLLALHGIGHLLASFSVSWQMYAAVCFIIGAGVGGIIPCSYLYPIEFLNDWWRGVLAALPIWHVSYVIFAVIVFILRDWRYVHISTTVFSALAFSLVFWTPESVRWLAVRGKVDQSKKVVARIARMNRQPFPNTTIIDNIADEEKRRMGSHTYTYLDLFRITSLRSFTIKFGIIWIILAYTYYVISFSVRALSGDFYINFLISSVLECPALIFVTPAINKLGRPKSALMFVFFEVSGCIALVIMSLSTSGTIKNLSVLAFALFTKMIGQCSWGIFSVYSSELYPTVVRNIHFGFLNGVSRLGSIVSPYLVPNDPDNIYIAFIVIASLGLIRFGLIWSLPETKGKTLHDTAHSENTGKNPVCEENEELM